MREKARDRRSHTTFRQPAQEVGGKRPGSCRYKGGTTKEERIRSKRLEASKKTSEQAASEGEKTPSGAISL